MKCGKTDLCDVNEIEDKYQVTWGRHVTGLKMFSSKVNILLDMIVNNSKSSQIGIVLNTGYVIWMSYSLRATMDMHDMAEFIVRAGRVKSHDEIVGAVFDNLDDVETFVDRLEKKYIVHLLKK